MKFLKVFGLIIIVVMVLAAGAVFYINANFPKVEAFEDLRVDITPERLERGEYLVNDVAAFTYDPKLLAVAAVANAPVCIMHAQGTPDTMQNDPTYDDVLLDIYDFLEERVQTAEAAGIPRDQIIVDPGIGFGKTLEHNLTILRGIAIFHSLGCPILLGASRKRFIGAIGGGEDARDRLGGSVAVALFGARQGVQILRVHDIFATKQALDLEWAIGGAAMT